MTSVISSNSQTSRHVRGMTLIELLVALAIVGLLAVILFDGLHFGVRVWDAAASSAADLDETVSVQQFLRGVLSHIDPSAPTTAHGIRHYAVEGDSTALVFSAPLPQGGDPGGHYRYHLYGTYEEGRQGVWIAWQPDARGDPMGDADSASHSEQLLPGVHGFSIDYLDRPELGPARWVSQWRENARIPSLIRVRVSYADKDARAWPDLIVRPRITTSATCEFDVVSRRCRA